jgi:hypothetical protein
VTCKLCKRDKKLVKAHVIPKSFFEIDPIDPLRLVSNTDGTFPKRAPSGIYDTTLVCDNCERLFSPFDDYAQQILLADREAARAILHENELIAYIYDSYDYVKLKLFFMSLLWRASQSSHKFFRRIDLGPHEPLLKKALIDADPGDPDFYAVILARFPKPLGVLDPHNERLDGVNFCRICLAGFVAYIKVDNRPTPESFQDFTLKPERPLLLIARDPAQSRDVRLLRKIAIKNMQLIRRDRKR